MSNILYKYYEHSIILKKIYKESFFGKKVIRPIVNIPYYLKWKFLALCQYLESLPRTIYLKDTNYLPLKSLKDSYKGKRIFIACTGPSLTIDDLEMLKNEYVFGMNSIAMIHDKTQWRPDFFGIQDINVWNKISSYVKRNDNGIVFIPRGFDRLGDMPKQWIRFHTSYAYHMFELCRTHKYFAKFSDDCYRTIYDGYSITYTILQLAIYMGFDEIYLIGADCTYMGHKKNFIEHGNIDPTVIHATERLYAAYSEAKKYAMHNGVKIFNATRGGCLELFERVKLEDIISNNSKNKRAL